MTYRQTSLTLLKPSKEVNIPDDVQAKVEDWYQTKHVPEEERAGSKISGYMRRKPVHLHKLAIVLHFARSDSMELEWADFEAALQILDGVQENLPKVFMGIGKNPFSFDMRSIIEFVEQRTRVRRQDILDNFFNSAPPKTLEELIQGCVASGNLKIEFVDKQVWYSIPPEDDE
jgi:hypothetical protein